MSVCSWTPKCDRPGTHELECQTRPGLIVLVTACEEHLAAAELHGYRLQHNTGTRAKGRPAHSGGEQPDEGRRR